MPSNSTLLTMVVSTPLRLAYGVPLVLVSIPLLLAGTFLTLDRSRSFPSSHEHLLPGAFEKAKRRWRALFGLQGGVGGLLSGYLFGLQLSTFLSLLIPAISASAPLSSKSFFPVWILSSITTTILGGRYRYYALFFSATCGGASLALAISVIIHPPLLARQILAPLFSCLFSLVVFLFCIPRFFHLLRPMLRVATASSGAFSLVVAIALLTHISAWADVWERLWVNNGEAWGTSKENGLSVAYCIFTCLGVSTDWALKRWLGECPDEKWDNYLANYAANLPNDASRAGVFQPLPTHPLLTRVLHPKKDIIFPSTTSNFLEDSISKDSIGLLYDNHAIQDPVKIFPYDDPQTLPGLLKKARSTKRPFAPTKKTRKREKILAQRKQPIKFGAEFSSDSSDDDSSGVYSSDIPHRGYRPWLKPRSPPSSSAPTLVETSAGAGGLEYDLDCEPRSKTGLSKADDADTSLDYSDYEEELGIHRKVPDGGGAQGAWLPNFIKQHASSSHVQNPSGSTTRGNKKGLTLTPMAAVPATPSLIKALDRVSAAQMQAFGVCNPSPLTHIYTAAAHASDVDASPMVRLDGIPIVHDSNPGDGDEQDQSVRAPSWDEFWRDVRRKAGS